MGRFLATALAALLLGGCVSQGKYDDAVKSAQTEHAQMLKQHAECEGRVTRLSDLLDQRDKTIADDQNRLTQSDTRANDLAQKLDDATAMNDGLRKELLRKGEDVERLVARSAAYRDLAMRLRKMVDPGALSIVLRDGRMVLQLPNDVLFDSGSTVLKPRGQKALDQIAGVLKTVPGRKFQIAGHTDNVPIQTTRYASNWDLSAGRALEVVRFLGAHGLKPTIMSAAGYGEFDPVAPNDAEAGRSKNRRIEITVQPNIDELVPLPDLR